MRPRFSGSCSDEDPRVFPRFPGLRGDLGAGSGGTGIFPESAEHGREPGEGGGGGSAAQKAREALNKAALQQAQAMRKARAAGQRPGQKPPYELPPGIEVIKEEYRPKLPPKVAKTILENNRVGMSPEFRDAITAYLRAIAERGRKKNPSPQKKK